MPRPFDRYPMLPFFTRWARGENARSLAKEAEIPYATFYSRMKLMNEEFEQEHGPCGEDDAS